MTNRWRQKRQSAAKIKRRLDAPARQLGRNVDAEKGCKLPANFRHHFLRGATDRTKSTNSAIDRANLIDQNCAMYGQSFRQQHLGRPWLQVRSHQTNNRRLIS